MLIRSTRFAGTAAALLAVVVIGSCTTPSKHLDALERRTCIAKGGYESRSAFGFPICQFRYADGGKACTGKADCQGRCLLNVDGAPQTQLPKPGQAANGVCDATQYNPGCFATIEGGKVTAEGAWCEE